MKKDLRTEFSTRQYMLSKDFEIYYYNDRNMPIVGMHSHNYYEFYFFLEGNVKMQIQDEQHILQYGDLILIPPGIYHRAVIENMDVPYRRFVFWISQEYCNHLLDIASDYVYLLQHVQIKKKYIFHNDRITFNTIQSRILRLIEEHRSEKFGHIPQIALCVNDLVLHLNRLVYEKNNPQNPQVAMSLYQNVAHYIENHLDENLSLDALAIEFYVSKYHIAHIFKDNIGLSIHQYITKKRLAACHEAIQSGSNISKTYQSFGFGDYSSFYRAFKKEYGMSPKDCQDMVTIEGDGRDKDS